MDEEIFDRVPCASLAIDSIIRLGAAGVVWGFFSGRYEARKLGFRGSSLTLFVARSAGEYGLQCGLVAGAFSFTRCWIQNYRGRNDLVNSMIAGSVAGAAVAARTRRWTSMVGMAGLISVLSTAVDYSRAV